jgi:serine/threonine protein phosphatase PrpC
MSVDYLEVEYPWAAGVTDRGLVRNRNEDALFLEVLAGRTTVAVVCDGVSSGIAGDLAAERAANVTGERLASRILDGPSSLADSTFDAIGAAGEAVAALWRAEHSPDEAPACTLVSTAIRPGEIVIGWVGDSRAYWLNDDVPRLLTTDDSWGQQQRRSGRMTRREVALDRRTHRITRWLGLNAPEEPPHVIELRGMTSGRLVVCSDGLWNYMRTSAALAALIPADASPIDAARALVRAARVSGGRDNITVVVIDLEGAS